MVISTQRDRVLDKPLPEIGGKGLFTQELEGELLGGGVHCAVHSLKDLPVENPAECVAEAGENRCRAETRAGFGCQAGGCTGAINPGRNDVHLSSGAKAPA